MIILGFRHRLVHIVLIVMFMILITAKRCNGWFATTRSIVTHHSATALSDA